MIETQLAFDVFQKLGLRFFTGVPDSLLKDFCAYVTDHVPESNHVIAANEGAAVALAAGYHLGTGEIPLVYLQNSGTGNTINPLLSLADPEVYGIPMLLMLGWRGEPGKKDEPQHIKQGRVMMDLLKSCEIPTVLARSASLEQFRDDVVKAYTLAKEGKCPTALVVPDGTFSPYKLSSKSPPAGAEMTREEALSFIMDHIDSSAVVVTTTGKTSREWYELRVQKGLGITQDFLTVGSMGHASQVALGMAIAQPHRSVFCLDGDGAVLMHMGSTAIQGQSGLKNFKHIVLNNGAHDSVGGQPTLGHRVSFSKVFEACGYSSLGRVVSASDLKQALSKLQSTAGPVFLEVVVHKGARDNLGRPKSSPRENKQQLMGALGTA